jgi:ppGpp synthetase/RelA/SpoT-type nucleotidyltranferase
VEAERPAAAPRVEAERPVAREAKPAAPVRPEGPITVIGTKAREVIQGSGPAKRAIDAVDAAVAPEIADNIPIRTGAKPLASDTAASNADSWQNGHILGHTQDTFESIVRMNNEVWAEALTTRTKAEGISDTEWAAANRRVGELMLKGMTRQEAVKEVAMEQSVRTAIVVAIDKSGLGDIDRTTGRIAGTRDGYSPADVINRELYSDMIQRAAEILRENGYPIAAHGLLGMQSDERALVVLGKSADVDIVIAVLNQAKAEVNDQMRGGGRKIPDEYVPAVTEARNRIRDMEVQERAAATKEGRGWETVTQEQQDRIFKEVAGKYGVDAGELAKNYKTPDIRTYQVEMGPNTMTLDKWAEVYPRHKNIVGDFTASAEAQEIRPGMPEGSLNEAYARADQRTSGYTEVVGGALGIKGKPGFDTRSAETSNVQSAVGQPAYEAGGRRMEMAAGAAGEPARVVEGDVVQVAFKLDSLGRMEVESALAKYIDGMANDVNVKPSEETLKRAKAAVEHTYEAERMDEKGRAEFVMQIARVMEKLQVNADEAKGIVRASKMGRIEIDLFASLVTRKGPGFAFGDIGMAEGNTFWAHDGQNQVAQTAVDGVVEAAPPKGEPGGARAAVDLGNQAWLLPTGTDTAAVQKSIEAKLATLGITDIKVEVRVVHVTPESQMTLPEVNARLMSLSLGVEMSPEAVEYGQFIVHMTHISDERVMLESLFGEKLEVLEKMRKSISYPEETLARLVAEGEVDPAKVQDYMDAYKAYYSVKEVRTNRDLRRFRDLVQHMKRQAWRKPGEIEANIASFLRFAENEGPKIVERYVNQGVRQPEEGGPAPVSGKPPAAAPKTEAKGPESASMKEADALAQELHEIQKRIAERKDTSQDYKRRDEIERTLSSQYQKVFAEKYGNQLEGKTWLEMQGLTEQKYREAAAERPETRGYGEEYGTRIETAEERRLREEIIYLTSEAQKKEPGFGSIREKVGQSLDPKNKANAEKLRSEADRLYRTAFDQQYREQGIFDMVGEEVAQIRAGKEKELAELQKKDFKGLTTEDKIRRIEIVAEIEYLKSREIVYGLDMAKSAARDSIREADAAHGAAVARGLGHEPIESPKEIMARSNKLADKTDALLERSFKAKYAVELEGKSKEEVAGILEEKRKELAGTEKGIDEVAYRRVVDGEERLIPKKGDRDPMNRALAERYVKAKEVEYLENYLKGMGEAPKPTEAAPAVKVPTIQEAHQTVAGYKESQGVLESQLKTMFGPESEIPATRTETRLKEPESLVKKITDKNDPNYVVEDIVGGTAIFRTQADAEKACQALEKRASESDSPFKIIRKKDYANDPKESGYRAVHYTVGLKDTDQTVEVKIQTEYQKQWGEETHRTLYKRNGVGPDGNPIPAKAHDAAESYAKAMADWVDARGKGQPVGPMPEKPAIVERYFPKEAMNLEPRTAPSEAIAKPAPAKQAAKPAEVSGAQKPAKQGKPRIEVMDDLPLEMEVETPKPAQAIKPGGEKAPVTIEDVVPEVIAKPETTEGRLFNRLLDNAVYAAEKPKRELEAFVGEVPEGAANRKKLAVNLQEEVTIIAERLERRSQRGELTLEDKIGYETSLAKAKQNGREKPNAEDFIYGALVQKATAPVAEMVRNGITAIKTAVPKEQQADVILGYTNTTAMIADKMHISKQPGINEVMAARRLFAFAAELHVAGLDALPLLTNNAKSGLLDLFPITNERSFKALDTAVIYSDSILNSVPKDAKVVREQRGKKIETQMPREEAIKVTLSYIYGDMKRMSLDSRSEYLLDMYQGFKWTSQWNEKVGEYLVDNKGNLVPREVPAQKLPALAYMINDPTGLLLKALDNSAVRNEMRTQKNFEAVLSLVRGLGKDYSTWEGSSIAPTYESWLALVTKRLEILAYGEKELKAAGIKGKINDVRQEFVRDIAPNLNALFNLMVSGRISEDGMKHISQTLVSPGTETKEGFVSAMVAEVGKIYGADLTTLGMTPQFISENPAMVLDLLSYRNRLPRFGSRGAEPVKDDLNYAGSSRFWKISVDEETGEMVRKHNHPYGANSRPEAFDETVPVLDQAITARAQGEESFRDFKFSEDFRSELKAKYGAEKGEKLFSEWRQDHAVEFTTETATYTISETGKFEDGFYGGRVKGETTCQDPSYDGMHIAGIIGTIELPWIKQIIVREPGTQDIIMRTRVFVVHGEDGQPILLVQPIYNSPSLRGAVELKAQLTKMLEERYAPLGVEIRVMPQEAMITDRGMNTGYMTFESGRSPLFYIDSNANTFRVGTNIGARNGLQGRTEGESVKFPKGWQGDFDLLQYAL